jgi:hypothetical protein
MNERIRQLWSQAGGHYDSGNQHTFPQYTIDDPKKFAELIVRECAVRVDWILAEGGGTQGDLIREHFGVSND